MAPSPADRLVSVKSQRGAGQRIELVERPSTRPG
jgi:hypothetical protein